MGTGDTERLWAAVDKLTKPLHLPVIRDDGTEVTGIVPCLWQLACDAIGTGNELAESVTVSQAYRSPADLDLLAIRRAVLAFVACHLERLHASRVGILHGPLVNGQVKHRVVVVRKGGQPAVELPELAQIRLLAEVVVAREPFQLEWWTGQFEHFARRIEFYLAPVSRGLRLRAPCPRCGVDRVRQETPTGPVLVHPIYVTMHQDRVVVHAQCQACEATWYRGEGLHVLAREWEAFERGSELRIAQRPLVAVG